MYSSQFHPAASGQPECVVWGSASACPWIVSRVGGRPAALHRYATSLADARYCSELGGKPGSAGPNSRGSRAQCSTPTEYVLASCACCAAYRSGTHWRTLPLCPITKWALVLLSGRCHMEAVPYGSPCPDVT